MMDIVKRLREGRTDGTDLRWMVTDVHVEAADLIESQQAEIERYRGAFRDLNEKVAQQLEEIERLRAASQWKTMKDAPQDGRPVIVLDSDGSGVFVVAFLSIDGNDGWWICQADEDPCPVPWAIASDDFFDNPCIQFPDHMLASAWRYVREQYDLPSPPTQEGGE